MFRTINSKFYTVVTLLLFSFGLAYLVSAYVLQQQSSSSEQVQNAIMLKTSIASLNKSFQSARFWEKEILSQSASEAEKHFGESLQHIRSLLTGFESREFSDNTRKSFKLILVNIEQYEMLVNEIVQLNNKRKLLDTRLLSTFQSISTLILQERDSALLRPLFGVAHYFLSYQISKESELYQALQLVVRGLVKKIQSTENTEPLLLTFLSNFEEKLKEDHAVGQTSKLTNRKIDNTSDELTHNVTDASTNLEQHIKSILQNSEQNRRKLRNIFLVSMMVGCVLLLFILRLLKGKIITPVETIAKVMTTVQKGDMGARFIPRVQERDEIVDMGLAFNDMLESLESRDITLLEYQEQLEEKVDELSRQREKEERLTSQLQRVEKMEAVGTLAGGVAHELNNILSGVVTYPELLLLEMPETSPYRKPLVAIHESGVRAVAIVQDLLTLARRGAAVRETINLNKLISSYLVSPEGEKLVSDHPNVTVKTELTEGLSNIKGSKVHLLKTIMNLVTNGIESINEGGTVTIKTENRYISRPIAGYDEVVEGEYVALIISDSGSGIAQKDMERIFEPFFSRKVRGGSGSGLGLAVVWGTVKDHKGYVDVQSSESEGTTFTIYCPICHKKPEGKVEKRSVDSLMGNGEKILIVDDVELQRDIARTMLENLGYKVHAAGSGEEAVNYFRKEGGEADLLVLDMLMAPGIDGLETYRQIIDLRPGQKAIIASGYSETDRVVEAQRLGVAAYIRKPYSLETMGAAIQKELQKENTA